MQTTTPITGKTLAQWWGQVTKGTRLTCVDNTYAPAHNGLTVTITRPGTTTMNATGDDGKGFHVTVKRKVSDVVSLTPDTITYKIGRDEHTATWRIEGEV